MSRWYKAGIICVLCFILLWFAIPEYYYKEKDGYYGVYRWQIGLGWNWRDEDGNPLHDAVGNSIHPNHVRTVILFAIGGAAVICFGAGLAYPKRRRPTSPS
jgi:hypothetical protein